VLGYPDEAQFLLFNKLFDIRFQHKHDCLGFSEARYVCPVLQVKELNLLVSDLTKKTHFRSKYLIFAVVFLE